MKFKFIRARSGCLEKMDVQSEKACLIMALLPILLQVAQLGGLHLIFI
jgi:hypothetical protein